MRAQLVAGGFVVQRRDPGDRRRRCLHLTAEAEALERALTARQSERITSAFAEAGPDAAAGFARVLCALINAEDRHRIAPMSDDRRRAAAGEGSC